MFVYFMVINCVSLFMAGINEHDNSIQVASNVFFKSYAKLQPIKYFPGIEIKFFSWIIHLYKMYGY